MPKHESIDLTLLPLGNSGFPAIRRKNKIYVDKTDLLSAIATLDVPIFFTRPRRFGKSLLVSTLASLFENGLEYFHDLAIEKIWNDKTYPVVRIDFSGFSSKNYLKFCEDLNDTIIDKFRINSSVYQNSSSHSPDRILSKICSKLDDSSTVILIDEYDAPLTHHLNEPDELKNIMNILNDFYATLKEYTKKFRFIFITGITRTSHLFSAFNKIIDLSLKKEFNSLLCFTEDELKQYFDQYINHAANVLNMSKDDIYKRIEQYYDGFQFCIDAKETVYNPWAILNFLRFPEDGFKNYWFKSSGSSSLIIQYLKNNSLFNSFNFKDMNVIQNEDDLSNRYEITNIPSEILLFQTGYFSLRKKTSTKGKLVFPNTEVEDSMTRLYLTSKNIKPDIEDYCDLDTFIESIDTKNLKLIVETFNAILNYCASSLSSVFHDERSIRDLIYAALPPSRLLQKIKERETVKGKSDLELLTKKTHLVLEFKRTHASRDAKASLDEAIAQIQSKRYGVTSFTKYNLYRVAMVISTEDKKILYDFCKEIR